MTNHPNRSQNQKRYDLARKIAFLETDRSAQTADEEAARMSRLQRAWDEYGPEDGLVCRLIEQQSKAVEEAIRYGEY